MPPAAGRNAELLLLSGSLREEQASSDGVIIIGRVGPVPSGVRGPFPGWLQPVVPSREARGPGRTERETTLDPAETRAAHGPRRAEGTALHLSFRTLRGKRGLLCLVKASLTVLYYGAVERLSARRYDYRRIHDPK